MKISMSYLVSVVRLECSIALNAVEIFFFQEMFRGMMLLNFIFGLPRFSCLDPKMSTSTHLSASDPVENTLTMISIKYLYKMVLVNSHVSNVILP